MAITSILIISKTNPCFLKTITLSLLLSIIGILENFFHNSYNYYRDENISSSATDRMNMKTLKRNKRKQ